MRMIPEYTLNAEDVRRMMLNTMETHLTVKTDGYRCSTGQTTNLLLKAVAAGSSLEAVCTDSCGIVSSNRLREQLNAALVADDLREQEAEMKRALQAAIPLGRPHGSLEVAMDSHDEPFYGKTPQHLQDARQRRHHALFPHRYCLCDLAGSAPDTGTDVGIAG